MKKFFITAAMAVAVASPALAASNHHARHSAASTQETYAQDGYAYAPDSTTVVSDGKVIGRDPDVFIRQSLLREGDHTNEQGAGN